MGAAAAAKAVEHESDRNRRGRDHDVEFDGDERMDGIDALARASVEAEAHKAADAPGTATPATGKATPESTPKHAPIDAQAGTRVPLGGGTWTVMTADSLWTIANDVYGKGTYWAEIKAANRDKVHGPQNIIRDGEIMSLPTLSVPTLVAFSNFADQPAKLRDLVTSMADEDYRGFLQNTPRATLEKHGQLLMDVEAMRSTGMTIDELAEEQKDFINKESKKAGKSPGEYVHDLVEREGYGGAPAQDWSRLSPKKKQDLQQRFLAVVKQIKASAPADIKGVIAAAEAKGGGFKWDPADTERNGAFAYTSGDWTLHCGVQWVLAAERGVERVYGNIAHEMGGHNEYGATNGWSIQAEALSKLGTTEEDKAYAGKNSAFTAYGYMETEIFAELYEFTYATLGNPTDTPFEVDAKGTDLRGERKRTTESGKPFRVGDVKEQLIRINVAFAPTVASAIVRGLWRRIQVDAVILAEAKRLFAADAKAVFGIELE